MEHKKQTPDETGLPSIAQIFHLAALRLEEGVPGTSALFRRSGMTMAYDPDHYKGEWFHMGPAINAFIKSKLKDCVAKTELSELPRPPRKDGLTGWDDAFPDEEVVL